MPQQRVFGFYGDSSSEGEQNAFVKLDIPFPLFSTLYRMIIPSEIGRITLRHVINQGQKPDGIGIGTLDSIS